MPGLVPDAFVLSTSYPAAVWQGAACCCSGRFGPFVHACASECCTVSTIHAYAVLQVPRTGTGRNPAHHQTLGKYWMWRSDPSAPVSMTVQPRCVGPAPLAFQPAHVDDTVSMEIGNADAPYEPPMELVRMLTDVDDDHQDGVHDEAAGMVYMSERHPDMARLMQAQPSKRARTSSQSLGSDSHDHSSGHSATAPSPEQAGSTLAIGSKQMAMQGACKDMQAEQHGGSLEQACSQGASPMAFGCDERQQAAPNATGMQQQMHNIQQHRSTPRKPDVCKQLDMLIEQVNALSHMSLTCFPALPVHAPVRP